MASSNISGRMAAPAVRVINPVPEPPVRAMCSKYPGPGPATVNTEPGVPEYQIKIDKTSYPDHVLPSGSEL